MSDQLDITQLQHELIELGLRLSAMSDEAAAARVIHEYYPDRAKAVLARHTVVFLDHGESAAAAEIRARADVLYAEDLKALIREKQVAEKITTAYKTICIRIDALRSVLSCQKSLANLM